jgi:hypothetical protein
MTIFFVPGRISGRKDYVFCLGQSGNVKRKKYVYL